jgi:hypothetical protein
LELAAARADDKQNQQAAEEKIRSITTYDGHRGIGDRLFIEQSPREEVSRTTASSANTMPVVL